MNVLRCCIDMLLVVVTSSYSWCLLVRLILCVLKFYHFYALQIFANTPFVEMEGVVGIWRLTTYVFVTRDTQGAIAKLLHPQRFRIWLK